MSSIYIGSDGREKSWLGKCTGCMHKCPVIMKVSPEGVAMHANLMNACRNPKCHLRIRPENMRSWVLVPEGFKAPTEQLTPKKEFDGRLMQ